jgi:anaerobic magnesium-protoporphyrin IX monomethyl ester cyclase
MRVLIVNPCARPDPRGFSPWSASVGMYAASLKASGHDPVVLNTAVYDEQQLRTAMSHSSAKLVLIETLSRQADQARAIGAFLALNFKGVPVFFAGPHASAWPADCLNVAQGVFVLRGWAEHLLGRLADAVTNGGDFYQMPGLSFPVMQKFYHNPIEDAPEMASRPLADRKISAYWEVAQEFSGKVGAEIETSRGEFNNSDRSQAVYDQSAPRTGVLLPFQQRSVTQVTDEAVALRELMPDLKCIGFRDENCVADPEWVRELAAVWPTKVGLPLWVTARPELLRESVFESLADAGCFRVQVMVESGSDHVRRKVLGRRCADSTLLYVARACRRFGLSMITVNEMGFPGETEDMIQQTVEMNRRMKPDWAMCGVYHPEPGTAVYQRADAKGWLSPSSYGSYYDPDVVVVQPWIRPRTMADYLSQFSERVFGDVPTVPVLSRR